jgi:nucleotidyltransferase/DNA polymerase involved in DNA repair
VKTGVVAAASYEARKFVSEVQLVMAKNSRPELIFCETKIRDLQGDFG